MTDSAQRLEMQVVTELRLKLLANGYTPLPNYDKRNFLKGWPAVEVDEAAIAAWGRKHKSFAATGLRLQDGLAVIDIDIDDTIAQRLLDASGSVLYRYGAGHKEARFMRASELFGRIHSRRWVPPSEPLDGPAQGIEIFGGQSPRQFGAFGAHTRLDNGEIPVAYNWEAGDSPETVHLDDLPLLSKQDFFAFIDKAEAMLEAEGWTPVLCSKIGENAAERVHDLVGGMLFELNTDENVGLDELRDRAGTSDLRCAASFIEQGADNRTRCIVGQTHDGQLTVWDSATDVTHLEVTPTIEDMIAEIGVSFAASAPSERTPVDDGDDLQSAATKLVWLYAFCPTAATKNVVPIDTTDIGAGMALSNMRIKYRPWGETVPAKTPQGNDTTKFRTPTDLWELSRDRLSVGGLRMRPDMPTPIYEEDGVTWVNTYRPVAHPAGGDVSIGIEFISQLVPDDVERHWFMSWLACKLRRPCEPGPGVIMVAEQYGTGRATFADLLGRLFGRRYVKAIKFGMLTGQVGQSQYNDWSADALIVVVNESSEDPIGAGSFRTKLNAYEHLKELVDPRQSEHLIVRKGEPNYMAPRYTSYIIATNHRDALVLPADDRRLAVLTNGSQRSPAYWEGLNVWMDDPANVGAFARYLDVYDVGEYTPHRHVPMFKAKHDMAYLSVSDIDQAVTDAIDGMKSELTTLDAIVSSAQAHLVQGDYAAPASGGALRRTARRRLYQLHRSEVKDGRIRMPDGRAHHACATSRTAAVKWAKASFEAIKTELEKGADEPRYLAPKSNVIPIPKRDGNRDGKNDEQN